MSTQTVLTEFLYGHLIGKKVKMRAGLSFGKVGTITDVDDDHYEGQHHRPIEVTIPNGAYPLVNWWRQRELEIIEPDEVE